LTDLIGLRYHWDLLYCQGFSPLIDPNVFLMLIMLGNASLLCEKPN
jgi:hypothetical protein